MLLDFRPDLGKPAIWSPSTGIARRQVGLVGAYHAAGARCRATGASQCSKTICDSTSSGSAPVAGDRVKIRERSASPMSTVRGFEPS